jgi:thiol:disulfide interchange protein
MRRYAFGYYVAMLLIALFLFGSVLRRVVYTAAEFFLWFLLVAAIAFAILAAWRTESNGK